MMKLARWRSALAMMFLLVASVTIGQPPANEKPLKPTDNAAAVKQLATFRVPDGFKVELFAAEPQLGSPVAFCLDERGRVFVAEEYRFNRGTRPSGFQQADDNCAASRSRQRLAGAARLASFGRRPQRTFGFVVRTRDRVLTTVGLRHCGGGHEAQ